MIIHPNIQLDANHFFTNVQVFSMPGKYTGNRTDGASVDLSLLALA
ncbi:hypothetical protein URH17368_1568 [Alicyclobacillus hesperidum URH17-3-68]|nr:hypothetical protein URH17368_1568 [Alicyclobacillus hesperidum URH17-3-68]